MDEISAEDEIREAFKVFDSVSWEGTKHNNYLYFRMVTASSTGKSWVM